MISIHDHNPHVHTFHTIITIQRTNTLISPTHNAIQIPAMFHTPYPKVTSLHLFYLIYFQAMSPSTPSLLLNYSLTSTALPWPIHILHSHPTLYSTQCLFTHGVALIF